MIIDDQYINNDSIVNMYVKVRSTGKLKPGIKRNIIKGNAYDDFEKEYTLVIILKEKRIHGASIAAVGYENISIHITVPSYEEGMKYINMLE